MRAGQLQQPLALGRRQRVPGRVLEVGDDVSELRPRPGDQHPLQRRHVDPVGLELDHPHVGAEVAQRQQRAIVGGQLGDHSVAVLDQRVEQKRVGLHRAVGDDHALRRHTMLLRDPLAQRPVADRGAVGGETGRVLAEGAIRRLPQAFDVDDVKRRSAACEGDRRHGPKGT